MFTLQDIKEISYDYQAKTMIIKLLDKKVINNFMTDIVRFKCSEKVFIEKADKFLKFRKEKVSL